MKRMIKYLPVLLLVFSLAGCSGQQTADGRTGGRHDDRYCDHDWGKTVHGKTL